MKINTLPLPLTVPPNAESITPAHANPQLYTQNFSNLYTLQGQQQKQVLDNNINTFDEEKVRLTLKKITELRLQDAAALNKIHKLEKMGMRYVDLLAFSVKA